MVFDPKQATNAAPTPPSPGGGMGGFMGALGGLGRGLTSPQAAPWWGLLLGNTAQAQNQMFSQGMQGLQQHRSQQERLDYAKQRDTVEDARAQEKLGMSRQKFDLAMEKHKKEIEQQQQDAQARSAIVPILAQELGGREDLARYFARTMDPKDVMEIATGRQGDVGFLDFKKGSPEEAKARAIKSKNPTLTDQQVVNTVARVYDFDPAGGLKNRATGGLVGVEAGPQESAQEQPAKGTLWDSIEYATGVGPAVRRGVDATVGQAAGMAGVDFGQAPKQQAAAQKFNTVLRDIRQSFSISDRGAVWEQELNARFAEPGIGTHPGTMEQKLIELTDYIDGLIEFNERLSVEPMMPGKERGEARVVAERLKKIKGDIGVPPGTRSALDENEPQGGGGGLGIGETIEPSPGVTIKRVR